jgi:hypothetical protein
MLKILLVTSQLIGIFLLNGVYSPKEVKIEHDLPRTTIMGSEHWVYVTIDKSRLGGFAKFQVDVPKGIQIEPGDIRGASFTFAEGSAKLIWMSLPDDGEFQISYKMLVYDDCEVGNNIVKQKFAYLEKNQRKVLTLDDHIMFVEEENLSNEYVPDTLANGTRTITKLNNDHYLVQIDLYKDGIKGFAKVQEFIPEGMNAEAVNKGRSVFTQQGNKVKFVWFTIPEEEQLKLTYEIFSDGPIDEEIAIEGDFTYLRNNESKTVKLDNTDDPSILSYLESQNQSDTSVSMIDKPDTDNPDLLTPDNPDFTVDQPDVTIDQPDVTIDQPALTIDQPDVTIDQPDVTIDQPVVTIDQPDVTIDQPVVTIDQPDVTIDQPDATIDQPDVTIDRDLIAVAETTDVAQDPVVFTEPITATADSSAVTIEPEVDQLGQVTDFPSPDKGVTYRVQIMAAKNLIDEEYLKKRHRFSAEFSIENHKSWIKYTTGSFSIYKEARNKRIYVNDNFNFDGPFVTAYNEGTRITVQEALMITRQKWYQ